MHIQKLHHLHFFPSQSLGTSSVLLFSDLITSSHVLFNISYHQDEQWGMIFLIEATVQA